MTPISDDEYAADLALDLGYPLIVVAPNVLGVINQTLQTLVVASCFREGLPVAGIVLNDSQVFEGDMSLDTNRAEVESRAQVPVLARVRYQAQEFEETIDWMALAKSAMAGAESGQLVESDKPSG